MTPIGASPTGRMGSGQARLIFIVVAYLLLAVAYMLATPPLEASDEYKHYPVVQYIETEGALPVLEPSSPGRWLQEAAQPPLYYLIMAGLSAPVDTSNLAELHQINKNAFVGDPNQVANKNLIFHQPELEAFPWHGSVLAIYLIRAATILLGAGTIVVVYRLALLFSSQDAALLAAALAAFNPMYLFVHAAVNNDALAILLGHLALLLLVRIWQTAPDPRGEWRRYALLGFILGLGMLTKLSLGGLLALSGLALALLAYRRRQPGILIVGGLQVLTVSLLVLSPWLLHNWRTYGDPTALSVFVEVQGIRSEPIGLDGWVGEFGTLYRSFWGLFGGVNVAAPGPVYQVFNLMALLGTLGFAFHWWRARRNGSLTYASGLWLAFAWPILVCILLVRWNLISPAFQGRLLFPALGCASLVWADGLLHLVGARRRRLAATILALGLLITAAILPWLTIRPAYAMPQPAAIVPAEAAFGPITFRSGSNEIALVGVDLPVNQSVTAGDEPVLITVYWRAQSSIEKDYLSAIHLLGRDLASVGRVNRTPASGMIPTSQWQAGQVWKDEYRIWVKEGAAAPTRLAIKATLYDPELRADIEAVGPSGEPIDLLVVGEARLASEEQPEVQPSNPVGTELENGLVLDGYDLSPEIGRPGKPWLLTVYWSAVESGDVDYTVFVHLLNSQGEQVLVADGPPLGGQYPTRMWQPGEHLIDLHQIDLPQDLAPGSYRLSVGLYNSQTLVRLARVDGGGDSFLWPVVVQEGE